MIHRICLRIKKHPIPWYVHPLLWVVLIYPYGYYFTAIHIPVESTTDASFLALQQYLMFYPAICWVLPTTLEGLYTKWQRALLGVMGLWLVAEVFIIAVSIGYGQLEFQIASLVAVIYDIENRSWLFPAASATVGVTLLYQICVILINERRDKDRTIRRYNNQIDRVASEWYESQLNPHVLNGLMMIARKLIYEKSHHASVAFQEIIRVLHFYLALKPHTTAILLKDELRQIERVQYLKELEQGGKLYLDWRVEVPEAGNVLIPPMLLLMLVKNMFKHGVLTNPGRPAKCSVLIDDQHLTVAIRNAVLPGASTTSGSKTGLEQIERKLRELYGDAFTFNHTRIENEFFVHLQLPVQVRNFR